MRSFSKQPPRRGNIAPLTVFLLPVFLAMTAFMVDTGYITVTMAQLQNAADAAALAGASKLMVPNVSPGLQNALAQSAVNSAVAEAQKYALLNTAAGVNLQLAASDIVVGYQSAPGAAVVPWSSGQPFPNAVQVTVRRDSTTNSPLSLFFGPAIGTSTWSGNATATASYNATRYQVTGFNTTASGPNPLLLPIGVDVNYLNTFLSTGQSPDGVVHDSYTAVLPSSALLPPSNVSNGPDKIPELTDVYPDNTSPGNFGLVNLNFTNPVNNSPQFENWILNGPTPADIATFGANGFQATPSNPTIVKGGPGMKSVLVSDLASIIGQSRVLPVFSAYSGEGSNTFYTIVGFVGVTVVQATGHGSGEQISFQPMPVIDPTATSTTNSTGSTTQYVYTLSPLSLNR